MICLTAQRSPCCSAADSILGSSRISPGSSSGNLTIPGSPGNPHPHHSKPSSSPKVSRMRRRQTPVSLDGQSGRLVRAAASDPGRLRFGCDARLLVWAEPEGQRIAMSGHDLHVIDGSRRAPKPPARGRDCRRLSAALELPIAHCLAAIAPRTAYSERSRRSGGCDPVSARCDASAAWKRSAAECLPLTEAVAASKE
jgi:hypothetical protein